MSILNDTVPNRVDFCEAEGRHALLREAHTTFILETENLTVVDYGDGPKLLGRCKKCGSTLTSTQAVPVDRVVATRINGASWTARVERSYIGAVGAATGTTFSDAILRAILDMVTQ